MSKRLLATNAFWSLLSHLLSRGSLMVAAIILARWFDTQSFAAYSYFQLTISMLATYAALGLGVAASKFFAEHAHAERESATSLLGTLWLASIVFALIAALCVLLLPGDWISAGLGIPRWLLATGVLILCLQIVPGGAVLGLEEYRRATWIAGGVAAITLVGSVVAVAAHDIGYAMYVLLLSAVLQLLGESLIVFRRIGVGAFRKAFPIQWNDLRTVLDVSAPLAIGGMIAASGSWVVGRIILGGPGGQHAFALFTIGLQWFALAMFLPGTMSRVFLPRMVKNTTANDPDNARAFTRKAISATLLASVMVGIAGIVVAPVILPMYGDKYQVGGWFIAAYVGAAVVSAPVTTLGNALLAHGGQWKRLGLMIGWGVILVCAAFAYRNEVIWGGAATYAVAYGALTVGFLLVARRMRVV